MKELISPVEHNTAYCKAGDVTTNKGLVNLYFRAMSWQIPGNFCRSTTYNPTCRSVLEKWYPHEAAFHFTKLNLVHFLIK